MNQPQLPPNPYVPPPQPGPGAYGQPPPPILGGLIPRNGKALVAYYCGIFALIPLLGAVLGPVAVVFGILGIQAANREPYRKGKIHAWVGIVCGGLFGLVYLGLVVLWIVALVATHK